MAFHAEPLPKKADYYSIKKDEDTGEVYFALPNPHGSKERHYFNPKTKVNGIAIEDPFQFLTGTIEDIYLTEKMLSDANKTVLRSMNISLGEDENGVRKVVSLPLKNNRFTDSFLKVLPNIDLTKEVRLMPYDFQPKTGSRRVGLSVYHRDENDEFKVKVKDFFTETTEKDGQFEFKNLHGLPEATAEDKEDWTFFYEKQSKFLVNYAKQNVLPKFQDKKQVAHDPIRAHSEEDPSQAIDDAFDRHYDAAMQGTEEQPF